MYPTTEQLEAEARTLPEADGVSDPFYMAYVEFVAANRRDHLAVLARAYGTVPAADRRAVERETAPVSRSALFASLRGKTEAERLLFARTVARVVAADRMPAGRR